MTTRAPLFLIFLLVSSAHAAVFESDGSVLVVQAKQIAASNGDTITIPAGTFNWATPLTVTKGIKLQGAGSGRIIARSLTSQTIGTGEKTFTTQSGLSLSTGQTLRVIQTAKRSNYMQGTVTSYTGTTLVVNITTTGGSGTNAFWHIATNPSTTILGNTSLGAELYLINITESSAASIEVSGIKFETTAISSMYLTRIDGGTSGGKPVLVHDCWFSSAPNGVVIRWQTNRGVIWNCSVDTDYSGPVAKICFQQQNNEVSVGKDGMTQASTMGAADTTGVNNLYMEDCDFHGESSVWDFSNYSRGVIRYCLFNNSSLGSHGADTGFGNRHYELYNNEFIQNTVVGVALPLNWWFNIRGGTGIIADNIMPDMNSQDWGNKLDLNMQEQNTRRNAGLYPCWGASTPGIQYPSPFGIGQSHNGTNAITDPIYIWGNTTNGTTAINPQAGVQEYEPNECGVNADLAADYIQAGRDYKYEAKPGYTKYDYPHPLRGGAQPEAPQHLEILP
jgi:hypothetical protein